MNRTVYRYQPKGYEVKVDRDAGVAATSLPFGLGKIVRLCVVTFLIVAVASTSFGQSADGTSSKALIDLQTLPSPPSDIAELIDRGAVTMITGNDARPKRDGDHQTDDPNIVAETHYRITYKFSSHAKWVLRRNQLTVRVKFARVQWEPSHVIWFLDAPVNGDLPNRDFWNIPVVRHEFDHVRISNDPRHKKMFLQSLKDNAIITRTVSSLETIDDETVDAIVQRMVDRQFAKVSELIEIRYRELDRVTDHGIKPIPVDSPINDWIENPAIESSKIDSSRD